MRKSFYFALALVVVSFLLSIYFYPQMPDRMVSHWNSLGQPNGYMSKFWGLFLMPIISLAIILLFIIIPRLDPLKKNIKKFENHYYGFVVGIVAFLLLIHIVSILWNLGTPISINLVLPIGLGILFFYIGIILKHSKRNWFMGIRTPWTLSSDYVWDKTHKLGGNLFQISGIISLAGIFFPRYAIYISIAPIGLSAIITVIYSYFVYKNQNKK